MSEKQRLPFVIIWIVIGVVIGYGICWKLHPKPDDPWLSGGVIKVDKIPQGAAMQELPGKETWQLVAFIAPDAAAPNHLLWWLTPDDETQQFPIPFQVDDLMIMTRLNDPVPTTREEFCQSFSSFLKEASGATTTPVRTVQSGQIEVFKCPGE